ncbi:hypothetical protein Ga0074812_108135 [Parafrankia irregularis]|uniref:Uncharacterized protein n=1 Tax=Parafrankia irregularis TaxID=795642 RepID=A0A0S4QND4_9ACTN|nr:hypothetical protein Ga0074812_108135 [Parafrankia irregularis]
MLFTGRRLVVRTAPSLHVRTMTLALAPSASQGVRAGLERAVAAQAEVLCRFAELTDLGPRPPQILRVWISSWSPETSGVAGDPLSVDEAAYAVTGRLPRAALMHPGMPTEIVSDTAGGLWEHLGELAALVPEPAWLARALMAEEGDVVAPNPEALPAWDTPIHGCTISIDGHELRLSGAGSEGEVVAAAEYEETSEAVRVRVQLGIQPGLTRRPGEPGAWRSESRSTPGGVRRGTGSRWSVAVRLARTLGGRPVYDLASTSATARSDAWKTWERQRSPRCF